MGWYQLGASQQKHLFEDYEGFDCYTPSEKTCTSAMVEIWGLSELLALDSLTCGDWEPPKGRNPYRTQQPRWWDMLRDVFLMPSGRTDADGTDLLWAFASDSRCAVGFECRGRWELDRDAIALPLRFLPDLSRRAGSGGLRIEARGKALSVTALYKGYTGQVGESPLPDIPASPDPPDSLVSFFRELAEAPREGEDMTVEANIMGKMLSVLGVRCNHWFYHPAAVSLGGGREKFNFMAWSDRSSDLRAVATCAARTVERKSF